MRCICKYTFILVIISFFTSCEVFMEEDIENGIVKILSPADGTKTEVVTQTFWWEEIEGATGYRLQIVEPSFDAAEIILMDTLVAGDKYDMTLYAGDFQWRIRAKNNAYQTVWTTADLTIISSDDLTRQKVRLRQPLAGYFTNQTNTTFKWDTLSYVDSYEVQIFQEAWGQTLLIDSMNITGNSIAFNLDEADIYWGVRAVNQTSESLFNYQRLVVDLTPPNTPVLLSPEDNSALTDTTVTFSWDSSDPVWDEVFDSLFVYEERSVLGNRLVYSDRYTNKETTIKLNNNTSYLWKLKSIDQAGNEGVFSQEFSFQLSN